MLKNVMVLGYLITTKFASACKAVFPAPAATGVHRLRNNWSSMLCQLVDENTFFTSRIQVHGKGPRSIYKATVIWGRRCGGKVICHEKVQQSILKEKGPFKYPVADLTFHILKFANPLPVYKL